MKTICRSLIAFLLLIPFLLSEIVQGQAPGQPDSALRAKKLIDSAITAFGGETKLRAADKVTVLYRAVNHPFGQNAAFGSAPANFERSGARTQIDFSGGRFVTEGQSSSAGGYKFFFRFVVSPQGSFSIDVLRNRRGNEV